MAQTPAHPLLSFPDDQIIQKLQEMSLDEILNFSLISEECKDLVKSIQIKGTSIRVSIGNDITIFVTTDSCNLQLHYYKQPNMYWGMGAYGRKKKLLTPRTVEVNVFDNDRHRISGPVLARSDLAFKDWLEHLQDIFNYHKIDIIQFYDNSAEFDIDDIREVFGNKSKFDLVFLESDAYEQLIFEKFSPIETLHIQKDSIQESKVPANILIQNFEYLNINEFFRPRVIITLDELLMINSKSIEVHGFRASPKYLNKFIKLWQKGSNPRMEYLCISFHTAEDDEVRRTIMRGIKHEVIPDNRERKFKTVELKIPRLVHGGMDMYRNDGVKATILFKRDQLLTIFYFYVWLDHCVVEF